VTVYPESGVKLIVDSTQYTKDMEAAIFLADYFDSLGDLTISIAADVDTASFDVELPQDGEEISVGVNVDVDTSSIESDIENAVPDTETFTAEADTTSIEGDVSNSVPDTESFTAEAETSGIEPAIAEAIPDEENINIQADITETDTAKETLAAVNTIKNLATLETVWNIAGNAVDLIKSFASFAVDPLLQVDDAVARINAETASAIPNVNALVTGIHDSDLGDSFDQISDVVIQAQQIGAPIEEAATAALKFTKVFKDQNPKDVLNAMNQLVGSGLVDNFEEAGDLLTTAFQNGANRSGDLLQTVNANATAFKDMGLDGKDALGLITQGLDAGFKSANDVATSVTKIKQNVTNAAGNDTSDVSKTLTMLGIANPAETGEAWSKDFIAEVIAGIQAAPVSDTDKQAMLSNLLGGKMGAKEFSSFMQLSPADAADVFVNMKGAADTAATEIDNSLGGAIDDFKLAAQVAATEFLSSDQIDLPGKIDKLKTGLQDALTVLQNDGSLSDALTVALKPIGFDDEFQGLEAMLGNFVIAILQVVSSIQSLDPKNWAAKAGTDATIAKMSATQLTFDLKVGNADDVSTEIATAVSRGVSPDKITAAVGTAVNELITDGSDDALAKAQALIDTLNKPVDMNNVPTLASGAPMNIEPVVTQDALDGFQKKIDDAKPVTVNVIPSTDAKDKFVENLFNPLTSASDTLDESATGATDALNTQNTAIDTQKTNATNAAIPVKKLADNTKTYGDAAKSAASGTSDTAYQLSAISGIAPGTAAGLSAVADALQIILDKAHAVGVAADNLAKKNGDTGGSTGGGTGTKPPIVSQNAAGTNSTGIGTFMTGEQGREFVTTNKDLAVLNNMTTEAIMAAMQSYIPGGSFASRGNVSNTINNTNIIPSEAVADSLGYRQAATLRGMN
jgi:hypothetical protein